MNQHDDKAHPLVSIGTIAVCCFRIVNGELGSGVILLSLAVSSLSSDQLAF